MPAQRRERRTLKKSQKLRDTEEVAALKDMQTGVVMLEGDWLLIPTTLPLSQPVYLSRRVVFPVVR